MSAKENTHLSKTPIKRLMRKARRELDSIEALFAGGKQPPAVVDSRGGAVVGLSNTQSDQDGAPMDRSGWLAGRRTCRFSPTRFRASATTAQRALLESRSVANEPRSSPSCQASGTSQASGVKQAKMSSCGFLRALTQPTHGIECLPQHPGGAHLMTAAVTAPSIWSRARQWVRDLTYENDRLRRRRFFARSEPEHHPRHGRTARPVGWHRGPCISHKTGSWSSSARALP